MAPTITTIPAITLQAIQPRLADNITLGNATFAYLRERGRMTLEEGADYLQEPINWALNSTAQSYTHYDPLALVAQEEITAAVYNWKQYSVSASISGLEKLKNNNRHGIIKAWGAKMQIAENSLISLMDAHVHADQTTKTATDLLGFDEFIEDDVTPGGIIGGINRGTETWWANKYTLGSVATITQDCRTAIFKATEGRQKPDFGITCMPAFEAIINQNAGKQRLMNDAMMKIGYDNIVINGITLMVDRNVPGEGVTAPSSTTNRWLLYFGNSEFLKLRIHQDRNFTPLAPERPLTQDAQVAFILFAGAMTLSNSRFQSCLEITG